MFNRALDKWKKVKAAQLYELHKLTFDFQNKTRLTLRIWCAILQSSYVPIWT